MKWFSILIILFLVGCAAYPNNIPSAYVSPLVYSRYTCTELHQEYTRLSSQLIALTTIQLKAAKHDQTAVAFAICIFPIIPFSADRGPELSQIKGHCESLELVARQKNCTKLLLAYKENLRKKMEEDKIRERNERERNNRRLEEIGMH